MAMFRRRSQPPPPVDVRVTYPDGTVIPLDTVYVGPNDCGIHVWQVTRPLPGSVDAVKLSCKMLPARTAIAATFVCQAPERGGP